MTRRDYRLIADIILTTPITQEERNELIETFAFSLSRLYTNFKRDVFYEVAGWKNVTSLGNERN